MAKLAIRGHAARGKEVIELLKMLGGNADGRNFGCHESRAYYINDDGRIKGMSVDSYHLIEYKVFTLEQFLNNYPYEVGDKVMLKSKNKEAIIERITWCCDTITYWIKYDGYIEGNWRAEDLEPYVEQSEEKDMNIPESMKRITDAAENLAASENIEKMSITNGDWISKEQRILFVKDAPNKTELVLGDDFEIIAEGGKTYVVRKRPKFPTTVDECLKVLGRTTFALDSMNGYKVMKLMNLQALLVCRDAYWKLAGDWRPDWTNYDQKKHSIEIVRDNIGFYDASEGNLILVFPTAQMRDAFYENFKELIEGCKELL